MFVIDQSETFKYPVSFKTPKEEGPGHETHSFTGVFKRLSVEELEKLTSDNSITDVQFAKQVMVGWAGITDSDGQEVEYNDAMFKQLLNIWGFAGAVVNAFREAVIEGARKN